MKKIPAIKSVMTPFPFWIDIQESLKNAERMMLEHNISHLPVKQQGEIIAVIAMSDIPLCQHRCRLNLLSQIGAMRNGTWVMQRNLKKK